jgi:tetratricopeptide (TPR) repeat protein
MAFEFTLRRCEINYTALSTNLTFSFFAGLRIVRDSRRKVMGRTFRACAWMLLLAGCTPVSQERLRDYSEEGMVLYTQGDFGHAGECFQAALALKPNDAALLYNVGHCYDRIDRIDVAEKYYVASLQQDPNFADCRHAYLALLFRTGRQAEAVQSVQAWLAANPQLAAAYAEEGWLFLQQGDLLRAQARLQQALELNPQDVNSLINLGQVYETLQRPDRALALYERALALSPNQLEVSRRIQILRAKGAAVPKPD